MSKNNLTYNTKTGKWDKSTSSNSNTASTSVTPKAKSTPEDKGTGETKKDSEKEIQEQIMNSLVGTIPVRPSELTLGLVAGETINILGLGKYLSGLYFISKVTKSLSPEGLTINLEVRKSEFKGMKKGGAEPKKTERKASVEKKPKNPFSKGDKVKIVGNATYTNAHQGVSVPEWVKKKTLTISQISSDGERALLQPINSWTKISNLVKA